MEEPVGKIYKATNIVNGKVYIGQTWKKLKDRISLHYSSNGCRHFHNALIKYGKESFIWEILETTDNQSVLDELEIKYIKDFSSIDNGYNLKDGGSNGSHSEETKLLLSEKFKEIFKDKDKRLKMSKMSKSFWENPDLVAKYKITLKEINNQPETKMNRSAAQKRRFEREDERLLASERTKNHFSNIDNKLSLSKKLKIYWDKEGSREKASLSAKANYLNNKLFVFYGKNKTDEIRKAISRGKGGKPFFAQKGDLVLKFDTQVDASNELNLFKSNIGKVLSGKRKSSGGWKFYYE